MIKKITDDLELGKIMDSGQCFRWYEEDGSYRIMSGSRCLYMTELGDGDYELDCSEEEFDAYWYDYLDLEEDYAAIRARIDPAEDPFLYEACEHEKGIRMLRQDPWEMLISFIISQNRNIPAIRRSIELLSEACGDRRVDSRGRGYYAFPGPEAVASLSEEELTACKLGYRTGYVHLAAVAVNEGSFDVASLMDADEEHTIESLKSLMGVGDKVANCVSLFGLHHMNAFPRDVWVKRILADKYPDGYPFESYSPYNGVYQQYMFAYYRGLAVGER